MALCVCVCDMWYLLWNGCLCVICGSVYGMAVCVWYVALFVELLGVCVCEMVVVVEWLLV